VLNLWGTKPDALYIDDRFPYGQLTCCLDHELTDTERRKRAQCCGCNSLTWPLRKTLDVETPHERERDTHTLLRSPSRRNDLGARTRWDRFFDILTIFHWSLSSVMSKRRTNGKTPHRQLISRKNLTSHWLHIKSKRNRRHLASFFFSAVCTHCYVII
jgi:hypothetical protein